MVNSTSIIPILFFISLDNHIPNNCRDFLLVSPVENKNNVLYCANKEMRDMVKLVSLQCIALRMRNRLPNTHRMPKVFRMKQIKMKKKGDAFEKSWWWVVYHQKLL